MLGRADRSDRAAYLARILGASVAATIDGVESH
jgi:hypothetical protein